MIRADARVREGRSKRTLLADSARASVGSVFGSAPGFLIPIAIATFFGANATTDAFLLALSVASMIANALAVTTQQAAIPFLIAARRNQHDVGTFVGEISAALLMLGAVPTVVLNGSVLWYVSSDARWNERDAHLLAQFLWIFVPYIALSVLCGTYSGVLNSEHRYVRVAMSPAIRSVIVLAAVFASPVIGVHALIAGYVVGEAGRFLYLLVSVRRIYPVRVFAWPRAVGMREFTRTAVAQILGSAVLAVVPLLDRMMAAPLGPGNLSLLDYTDRLWQVPIGFAMSGFMVTSLSHWSERVDGGQPTALATATRRAAIYASLLFAGPCAAFVVFRAPIVSFLMGATRLTPANVSILTSTLAIMIAGTPIYIAGLTYTRAFLVLKRSDLLLAINIVQIVLKVTLNLLLIPRLGLVGIAAATMLMYIVSSILLFALFHLRLTRAAELPTRPDVTMPALCEPSKVLDR